MKARKPDPSKRYRVNQYDGVAFYFYGYPQVWEPYTCLMSDNEGHDWEEDTGDGEWVDDTHSGMVLMVMVGDDYRHKVDFDDCTEIKSSDYCHVCGQIGCTADGRG